MLTSSTGTRVRASSAKRASIPSYRPQANTRCAERAYAAAISCWNGTPLGVGRISLAAGGPVPITASSASPHGPGLITMPGPPPKGESSTLRCTSCAQARRSCTARSIMPRSAALPSREARRGVKYSGKIVMMSIFTAPVLVVGGRSKVEQAWRGVDDHFPRGQVHLDGDRGHEGHEHLCLPLGPGGGRDREQVLAVVEDIADRAHDFPGHGHHGQPGELVVVELVRVLRQGHVGGVDREQDAAQRLGVGAADDLREGDQQAPAVPSRGRDGQRSRLGRVGGKHGPVGEPLAGIVGTDLDRQLPPEPVRPEDPADHQWGAQLPDLVDVKQVYPDVTAARERADDRAQRTGGPPAAADHLAEVIRVYPNLEDPAPAQPVAGDADVVGVVHDALDQMLERFLEHLRRRRPGPRPRSRRSRRGLRPLARLRCLPRRRRSRPPWRQPRPCHPCPWPRPWMPRPWRPRPCRCPPWPRCPWRRCPWRRCPWRRCPWRRCPWRRCPWPRCPWPLRPWMLRLWRRCPWPLHLWRRCPWPLRPWPCPWPLRLWRRCPWMPCPWPLRLWRRCPWPPHRRPPSPGWPASRQNGACPPRPARRRPCRRSRPYVPGPCPRPCRPWRRRPWRRPPSARLPWFRPPCSWA